MKFAACIGSAGYPHFTDLNVCLLRSCFGGDVPIVIRDDRSVESAKIEQVAATRDCYYACTDVPLGHFAGDVQAFIDALVLADNESADVAIKLSQRACVAHPDLKGIIEGYFQRNPEIAVLMAGRPNPHLTKEGHKNFARFPILTDIVFMRRGAISPEDIKLGYEDGVRNSTKYHDSFVEVFWDRLRNGRLAGKVLPIPELTDHRNGQPRLYLRRYQCNEHEYISRATALGITGERWDLGERSKMMRGYNPRPRLVA